METPSNNSAEKELPADSAVKPEDEDSSVVEQSSSSSQYFRPENTYGKASLYSKIFFKWPGELLKLGVLKPIEETDLPELMEAEQSKPRREHFEKLWRDEVDRVEVLKQKYPLGSKKRAQLKPSLKRALLIDFFKSCWIIQVWMCSSSIGRIAMSLALGELIQSFIDRSKVGYFWAGVVVFCNTVVLFEHHHVFFITWRKGMQYRIGAVASIFSKSLRLTSIAGNDSVSVGKTVNLISNDVERFLMATLFGNYIVWAPLQAIAILIIGIHMIGPAFAVGVGILLFFFIPAQMYLSNRFASLRSKVAAITDERMNLVSQAIEGVRVMKMSGWENELQKRILAARAKEIHQIHKANRCKAANEGMFFITYGVVSTIIFIFHVFVFGGTLVTKDVFTIFSLISVMQLEMTKHLSLGVYACAELWISVSRIQKFLETPELEKPSSKSMEDGNAMSETEKEDAIVLKNLTCYWGKRNEESDDGDAENSDNADEVVALDNIDLSFKKNELTFVVGAVGSGKSALLYALAGELLPDHGQIDRSHSTLAYAAQNPWIMNGTVRENILMGAEYDQQFYQEVVEACGLIQDFTQFIHGDETIVGDRGVQCSGGQKARIGLARALYIDADVVLLDDPLSAVDSKVGRHIFYEAVQGLGLKRGKCVVLVTHQHQYIGSGRCIHISNGKVKSIGTFEDCVKNSDGTLHLVSHNAEDLEESIHNVEAEDTDKPVKSSKVKNVSQEDPIQGASKQVDQQETKITGVVTKSTFLHYARSMGGLMTVAGLLIIFLIASAMNLINTVVVGRWSELDAESQKSGRILITVLGLIALYITFSFLQSLTTFALTIRASKRLHDKMVAAILRAKIEFFDTNPSGRILNRFAGDTGSNDDLLPATVFDFTMCLFYVSGAILTAIVALPFILVVMPPLIWYFLRVRKIFVITSRELKRFEGLARSPIFAMLSESINGISTIRPNGVETYISKKFEDYHDTHSRAFWSFLASSRWLGFRMDFLMYVNCSASCFLAVLFNVEGWFEVDPVIFGLALSLLIQLGSIFQWTIRQSAEIVNQMVCVERVTEYSKVEPEAALITGRDADADLASWPVNGSIEVTDLSVRYRESLPLSLNSVTFSVPSGKRLGIVGRTGSGKSTLVQALFRILEAENGKIMVDGVDISELGLHKLRTGLSVINQYPVLFSGCTVRENLDPFGRYSKEEVVEALTDVQMIEVVNALPQGMNSQVADGGMNFSVGERQLLCLARAMLQKSKILVLDEPTANVDGRTDKLLQQAVDKSFKGATIISVAHRLDTIIENDLILVLGRGEVLEFGSPSELLSIEDGQFSSMVNDTGAEMSRALKATAMRNQK